jgi:predicted acyl esterase
MIRLLAVATAAALTVGPAAAATQLAAASTSTLAAPVTTATSAWEARPARFADVATRHDVPITMSDGVRLFADIHRPARADGTVVSRRLPVLVVLTAYNKSVPMVSPDYLVRRGYVMVVVDVRGTGSSEGTWSAFGLREQRDGAEVVEWAHDRARPWSDGRVGMLGPSYLGISQLFTAARQPAGLKAIFPTVPAGDVYRDVVASGGQLDVGFIPLWLGLVTTTGLIPPAYTATDPVGALDVLLGHIGGAATFQGPLLTQAISGGKAAYDGRFYRNRSPLSVVDRIRVPTFIVGGEYDLFQRGEPMLFDALQERGVPTKLVYGPWNHLQASTTPGLSRSGLPSIEALQLRWFDHWVKGRPDPALDRDIAPIAYYEQGSDRWWAARRWLDRDITARSWRLSGTSAPGAPGDLVSGRATVGADPVPPVPVAGLCHPQRIAVDRRRPERVRPADQSVRRRQSAQRPAGHLLRDVSTAEAGTAARTDQRSALRLDHDVRRHALGARRGRRAGRVGDPAHWGLADDQPARARPESYGPPRRRDPAAVPPIHPGVQASGRAGRGRTRRRRGVPDRSAAGARSPASDHRAGVRRASSAAVSTGRGEHARRHHHPPLRPLPVQRHAARPRLSRTHSGSARFGPCES